MNFNSRSWLKNLDLHSYLATIPIPVFIVLIAVLTPFDNKAVLVPPLLLPILNTIFISVIYFVVAYISAKSYLARGSQGIFLFGCGMLVFGFAALLGGWLVGAPDGININVILVNIGALFGSIFHLMGALLTSIGVNQELDSKRRKYSLAIAYPGVMIFIILLAISSLQGIIPPFFIQGTGFTALREVVLGTATLLFAISALLFIRLYSRLKEIYLYWYSLALMLVTIGLFTSFLVQTAGSLFSWVAARLPLYLGGIYFLNAIFIARRTARTRGTPIEVAVANFFSDPETNFRAIVETVNDAIVSFDNEGRVLLWNPAAEKIFGYNRSEILGLTLSSLIMPDSHADIMKKEMESLTIAAKSAPIRKTIEMQAKRRDGKAFPVEFSISARKVSDVWIYTSIIKDITERKRAEEALRRSEEKFSTAFHGNIAGMSISQLRDGLIIDANDRWLELFGFRREEVIGKIIAMRAWKNAEERTQMVHDLEQHGAFHNREIHFLKKTGEGWIGMVSAQVTTLYGEPVIISSAIDITERKKADGQLAYQANLLANVNDAIIATDLERRITSWNSAAERMFGWKREQVLGKPASEIVRSEFTEEQRAESLRVMRQGIAYTLQLLVYHKDGHPIWNESTNVVVRDSAGAVTGYISVNRDITERKRAEEALAADLAATTRLMQIGARFVKEGELADVLGDIVDAAIAITHADMGNIQLLDAQSGSLKIAASRGFEQPFLDFWNAVADGQGACGTAMENAQRVIVEDVAQSPIFVGTPALDIQINAGVRAVQSTPLFGHSGVLIGMLSTHWHVPHRPDQRELHLLDLLAQEAVDITERTRAEEALRKAHDELEIRVQERTAELEGKNVELGAEINKCKQAEEKIREQAALLDNAQEAIGVRSLEHRLIYWNKGAERLYGWTAEEAIGKNPIEFLFKDKEEPHQLTEAKRIVLDKGEWTGELHQVMKGGREVIVESHWTLICDSEGKPKSILVVNTDITEKNKLEAQLLRSQRMESIGTLAGGIAHDLNNVLTPMMLSLQMLKEKFRDDQSQKLLTILEKNSQRGANLIKQVLSFSRGVEGERTPLQITSHISEIEKVLKETFPRNIEIRTDIPKDLFTISGDSTQLHQVIMNLCVNARDAMPDGGILSISAENFLIDENYARMHTEAKVGSYVAITVSDTGCF